MFSSLIALALAGPPERPVVVSPQAVETPTRAGSLLTPQATARVTDQPIVGSLVTVHVDEKTIAKVSAATNTNVTSNTSGSVDRAFGLVGRLKGQNDNLANDEGEGIGFSAGRAGDFDGSGDTSRDSSTQAVLTCEVIEVRADGVLRIWGYKAITANGETQYLEVEGLVREEDIDLNNIVPSARIARAEIHLTGEGVIDDRQEPGAATRVIDTVWPF
jgi:flagellar L-ring protein FlgH